ncbi:MAG: ABC transporter ATP-binding protein, partial [Scytonema sp. PMC 1069.18]|nr:ABC transporter ATP-binding protein [Scytonema sp. PMC 1069.18]
GTVYVLFYYTNLLQDPIEKIRQQLEDFQQAEASIYRLRALLQMPRQEDNGDRTLEVGALSVEFDNVFFSYESSHVGECESTPWVLKDISFYLPPNQVLGILGRTGSGKTTITRLLLRFYQPQLGCIRLNGTPIHEISLTKLPQYVGLVTQDVQLFQTTVRNNLTFFNPNISDEQIFDVLQELGLLEWLFSLPNGLDTPLTSDSGGLSAGQAQLLAFARVFLKNPGLVILDEASSRLDPKTETYLEAAIDKLLAGRTAIIIAHRLQTLQRANQILTLENGKIVEYGSRSDLVNNPHSQFAQFLQSDFIKK